MIAKRRRGITLMEAMIVVMLVAAATALASYLLRSTLRADRELINAREDAYRLDAAVRALRKDVWSAQTIEVVSERKVTLRHAGSSFVSWSFDDSRGLLRQANGEANRSWQLAEPLGFSAAGPALLVVSPNDHPQRGAAITILSQQALLGGRGAP